MLKLFIFTLLFLGFGASGYYFYNHFLIERNVMGIYTALNSKTPTPTPSPTPTPTPTPTPGPISDPRPGEPFATAPLCGSDVHDKTEYHSLWNSEVGCHYDHHHGDNPHDADSALGDDLFDKMDGEISYPWQTFSSAGLENDLKHAGYFWHVRKDIPCTGGTPCITAFRVLVHQHPSGRDATVRYHSYVFEAKTSDDGHFLLGGWSDFGDLHVPEGNIVVNETGNHDSKAGNGAGRHKQHSTSTGQIIWYGASQVKVGENWPRGFATISTSIHDTWDYTSATEPAKYDDYICHGRVPAGRCRNNATTLRPHLIAINMISDFNSIIDSDNNGTSDFEGYADRYGRPITSSECSDYGLDCAPMELEGLKINTNYKAADSHTALSYKDYDIYFNGQSSGWSQPVQ